MFNRIRGILGFRNTNKTPTLSFISETKNYINDILIRPNVLNDEGLSEAEITRTILQCAFNAYNYLQKKVTPFVSSPSELNFHQVTFLISFEYAWTKAGFNEKILDISTGGREHKYLALLRRNNVCPNIIEEQRRYNQRYPLVALHQTVLNPRVPRIATNRIHNIPNRVYNTPVSKCIQKKNLMDDDLRSDMNITMFRLPNSSFECLTYDDLVGTLEGQEKLYLWEQTPEDINRRAIGRPLRYAPVYKLPFSGIWVQSNINLLLRYNTYIVKSVGKLKIGSEFGVSRLHGAEENVYKVYPINRVNILNDLNINNIDERTIFKPTVNDINNDSKFPLKPNTVTVISRDGDFTEKNRETGKVYYIFGQDPIILL